MIDVIRIPVQVLNMHKGLLGQEYAVVPTGMEVLVFVAVVKHHNQHLLPTVVAGLMVLNAVLMVQEHVTPPVLAARTVEDLIITVQVAGVVTANIIKSPEIIFTYKFFMLS